MELLRRVLIIVLIIVFLYCLLLTVTTLYGYHEAKTSHEESRTLALVPEIITLKPHTEDTSAIDPVFEAVKNINLEAIKEINPEVIAWIIIPDTNISYPVLKSEDNSFYLTHTWKREENRSGSVFADYRCSESFDDFNTILYGHRMANGSMFASLAKYDDEEFFKNHPAVYIITEESFKKYEVFSAYEAYAKQGHTYKLDLDTDEAKQVYLDYCISNSCQKTDFVPTTETKTVTLSTCTGRVDDYTKRWVVHAALVFEEEITEAATE